MGSHLKELLVRGCSSKSYYNVNLISDDNIIFVEKLKTKKSCKIGKEENSNCPS